MVCEILHTVLLASSVSLNLACHAAACLDQSYINILHLFLLNVADYIMSHIVRRYPK